MRPTLMLCLALATVGAAHAAPGEFDLGFGQQGISTLPQTGFASAHFVATDFAKRVVSGGIASGTDAIMRTFPDGALDTELAGRGYALGPVEILSYRTNLATLPVEGGRTLVFRSEHAVCFGPGAGFCATSPGNFFVDRIEANGQLDVSYGNQGSTRITDPAFPRGLAAEPDGTLILLGLRPFGQGISLKRVGPGGQEDFTFSDRASATAICAGHLPVQLTGAALMRQSDGKLLVAQAYAAGSLADPSSYPQCVRRLNADGTLDTSYGVQGQRDFNAPLFTGQYTYPVAVLPAPNNGAAIVFQLNRSPPASTRFLHVFAWLREDGSFDTSRFDQGVDGPSDMHVGRVTAAAIQSDGKIVLAGFPNLPTAAEGYDRSEPRVGRFNYPSGNDLTFGVGGQGYTPLLSFARRVEPNHLHIAADNVIYVAGAQGAAGPVNQNEMLRYAIAKLQGDSPPPSGGSGGGGGCGTISTPMPPDPTLPALVLLALTLLLARRRRVGR